MGIGICNYNSESWRLLAALFVSINSDVLIWQTHLSAKKKKKKNFITCLGFHNLFINLLWFMGMIINYSIKLKCTHSLASLTSRTY
jgi:hypothetical protein